MTQSLSSQPAGVKPVQALVAIERELSQGITFNYKAPVQGPLLRGEKRELLTATESASNIFKSAFSAVDRGGASVAQSIYSFAQEMAGQPVALNVIDGREYHNIGGIVASGIAAFLATLARVATFAIAVIAGAGAVVLDIPRTLIENTKKDADQAAKSRGNVELIAMRGRMSGTESREAIESSLKFLEELVPTRLNDFGREIVDESKEDEVAADKARILLKAQLWRMDAEDKNSFIHRVTSLPGAAVNRIAANPYLNNRVVKAAAVVGLGAAALYGASYLPVVGPVLCNASSRLASYMPNLSFFNSTPSAIVQPVSPIQPIAKIFEHVEPVCTMADKEAAQWIEQGVSTLADDPQLTALQVYRDPSVYLQPRVYTPVCTMADKAGAQMVEVAEAAAEQVLKTTNQTAAEILRNASQTAAQITETANEAAKLVLAQSKAALAEALAKAGTTAAPVKTGWYMLEQARILLVGILGTATVVHAASQRLNLRPRPPRIIA